MYHIKRNQIKRISLTLVTNWFLDEIIKSLIPTSGIKAFFGDFERAKQIEYKKKYYKKKKWKVWLISLIGMKYKQENDDT